MCPYASALLYPLGRFLAVLLLGHRVVLFLIFWGTSILFSRVATPVCIPSNGARGFSFLHILTTPVISCVVNFSHSDRGEVLSPCSFDMHFPDDKWCWVSFHVSFGHLDVFFGKMSIHVFCPFFNWIIWFLGCWVLLVLYFRCWPFTRYVIYK